MNKLLKSRIPIKPALKCSEANFTKIMEVVSEQLAILSESDEALYVTAVLFEFGKKESESAKAGESGPESAEAVEPDLAEEVEVEAEPESPGLEVNASDERIDENS